MSKANKLQQSHDVLGALRARLQEVQAEPTVQGWHQLGVVLSELGESLRHTNPQRAVQFFAAACRAFDKAFDLIPRLPRINVARIGVSNDQILAQARWAGIVPLEFESLQLIAALQRNQTDLKGQLLDKPGDGNVIHMLAITTAFLMRLHFGEVLGFPWPPNPSAAIRAYNESSAYFAQESANTPDQERAYRSMLLYAAIGFKDLRWFLTREALKSAKRHGDSQHRRRAWAVRLLGQRGEVMVRRRRDKGAQEFPLELLNF